MKTLIPLFAALLMLTFSSCSSDEAIKASSPTNSDLMLELAETRWSLENGPSHPFLVINGFTENEYLDHINFSDSKVYITPKNSGYISTHYICFVNGDNLVVSKQECSNTTWRSLFEWKVISIDGNTMTIDVTAPELAPAYKERFEYIRI